MKYTSFKKAFSMLELVFVIVILGIVSSIGSSMIAQLYENYITQKAMHNVSLKTELAINQIVNRLTYRIDNTIIARRADGNFASLQSFNFGSNNTDRAVLEWIGYDEESFSAQARPGWSGYCDIVATSAASGIVTPGSNLDDTETIVQNLAGTTATPTLGLLFGLNGTSDGGTLPQPECYGYNNDGNTGCIHQVNRVNNTTLSTDRAALTATISDQYKLAWSAYSIVAVNKDALYPEDGGVRDGAIVSNADVTPRSFDLELRYGYQPWAGGYYDNANTPRATLIRNVTSFKYAEQGGTIRIKLCATERIAEDINDTNNISVCKEKVVIR